MLNYYNRTIEPIVFSITDELNRKFLSKTARTQGQRIKGFYDFFGLISVNEMAEIADKFTRNEILSSNEVRAIMAMTPANDPQADILRNKNMPLPTSASAPDSSAPPVVNDSTDYDRILEETLAGIEQDINDILKVPNNGRA